MVNLLVFGFLFISSYSLIRASNSSNSSIPSDPTCSSLVSSIVDDSEKNVSLLSKDLQKINLEGREKDMTLTQGENILKKLRNKKKSSNKTVKNELESYFNENIPNAITHSLRKEDKIGIFDTEYEIDTVTGRLGSRFPKDIIDIMMGYDSDKAQRETMAKVTNRLGVSVENLNFTSEFLKELAPLINDIKGKFSFNDLF